MGRNLDLDNCQTSKQQSWRRMLRSWTKTNGGSAMKGERGILDLSRIEVLVADLEEIFCETLHILTT